MTQAPASKKITLLGAGILSSLVLIAAAPAMAVPVATSSSSSTDPGTGDGSGIENVATVSGFFGSTEYTNDAFEEVPVVSADPAVSITKVAAITTDNGTADVADKDDVITYTYTVSNDGNVTLTSITVTDAHDGSGTLSTIDCGSGTATVASLAPGATAECSATYTVTQSDVDTLQ